MKIRNKILLLSTIYPAPDIKIPNNTNVVHYFASEWVKLGYDVLVVHNYPVYLRIFHWIARFAEKIIASKFNTSVTSVHQDKDVEFVMDGVKVVRMPLFKPLPRFGVPAKYLNGQIEKIADYCKRIGFVPDVITSHNFYPHLPMVNQLKEMYFPNAKTCVVVHKQVWKMLNYCGNDYKKEIAKVNIWGYRSLPLKREFEENTGVIPKNHFMCYSGIPIHFLDRKEYCDIVQPINRYVYVGSFIRRKYPEKVLQGILKSKLDKNFQLNYVGDGANRGLIEKLISANGVEKQVKLHGFVDREEVPNYIAQAQCFIMISEEETFGLVYLEAMSMGCITIASRNEGMEGIIEDGVNGFLCKAGDELELAEIINRINTMPIEKLLKISGNAKATALKLTDKNVAEVYIKSINKS
ncbi:MAG: glycosyltransferase family 4 protein [Bacteroidaceae bacterium]|nr:glycosyltransferase family 4 protein [Bacteroidaceae bacterium]